MTKFDDRKMEKRAREEELLRREIARDERLPWQRAILADLLEISTGLEETAREVLTSMDEIKRKEFMRELQGIKAKILTLKKRIL